MPPGAPQTLERPFNDEFSLARHRREPEHGPAVLFLSGGSALRHVSRVLKEYTHNSIHIVTPFDSGGSSAELREAFGILSVGDLRNRLMALSDPGLRGNPEIYRLFGHRLSSDADPDELFEQLHSLADGDDPLVADIPAPMSAIVRAQLREFVNSMPPNFDLRGASIGNLLLAGGYQQLGGNLDSVVFLVSKLIEAHGIVIPVVNESRHLRATLADGTHVIGQHRITGKETAPIDSPIVALELIASLTDPRPADARLRSDVARMVHHADLICYPPGSFFTSVVANLLPSGMGTAIASAECSKIYVPNLGHDPEQLGMTAADCVQRILATVRRDSGEDTPTAAVLTAVLVDTERATYDTRLDLERIRALGISVIDTQLCAQSGDRCVDPERLAALLLSIA
jgi:CofD-related protein of GAK system